MRLLRWALLITGVLLVLWPVIGLTLIAILMHPFGGIPWSYDLIETNAWLAEFWGSVFLLGFVIIGFAAILFVRARRREFSI